MERGSKQENCSFFAKALCQCKNQVVVLCSLHIDYTFITGDTNEERLGVCTRLSVLY